MHLLLIAILPAIVLMFVIYKCDKIEKEPIGLVIGIVALGMLSCIPTVICELIGDFFLTSILDSESIVYIFLHAFLGVAFIEEFWKLVVILLFIWRNKAFNYRFDAIVYCAASSLGFALLENILYVFQNGFATGIGRAIISVPGHCTFAIFMGFFLGNAKLYSVKGNTSKCALWLMLSLLLPTLQHGFFDFCLMSGNTWFVLIFFGFIVVCDIIAIVTVILSEKQDTSFHILQQGDRWISNPEWLKMAAIALDEQVPNIQYKNQKK